MSGAYGQRKVTARGYKPRYEADSNTQAGGLHDNSLATILFEYSPYGSKAYGNNDFVSELDYKLQGSLFKSNNWL